MHERGEGSALPPAGGKALHEVQRWTADRKVAVVLRLLRGESLDLLARECSRSAAELTQWREDFVAAGREGLRTRAGPPERELQQAQAKIGALALRLEIAEAALAKRGVPTPRRCAP
jgi:hypothetical protein